MYNRSLASSSAARLERLELATATRVTITLTVDPPPAGSRSARLAITAGGRRSTYPVDVHRRTTAKIVIDAAGARVLGLERAESRRVPLGRDASVTFGLFATPAKGGKEQYLDGQILPVRSGPSGIVSVLAPAGQVAAVGEGRRPAIHLDLTASGRAGGSPTRGSAISGSPTTGAAPRGSPP
jgi:hypothetical protein